MNSSLFVRPTLFIVSTAVIAACSSGGKTPASTSAAPAPAAPAAAARASAATPAAPSGSANITPAMIAAGDSLFHANACQRCHGPDAKGRANGPSLLGPSFMHVSGSYDDIVRIITTGVPAESIKDASHRFPMPARGNRQAPLTDDQIKDVAAYVYSLSHK